MAGQTNKLPGRNGRPSLAPFLLKRDGSAAAARAWAVAPPPPGEPAFAPLPTALHAAPAAAQPCRARHLLILDFPSRQLLTNPSPHEVAAGCRNRDSCPPSFAAGCTG